MVKKIKVNNNITNTEETNTDTNTESNIGTNTEINSSKKTKKVTKPKSKKAVKTVKAIKVSKKKTVKEKEKVEKKLKNNNETVLNKEIKINEKVIKNNLNNLNKKENSKNYKNLTFPKKNKTDFNSIIYDCVEEANLNATYKNDEKNLKKNEKKYNNSFDDILSFREKMTVSEINNIDTIVYHDENNDGMFGCAIAYHYLNEKNNKKNNGLNNRNKKINLIAIKPGFFIPSENLYRNKNVLIIDVSFNEETINNIMNLCKSVIIIDDHVKTLVSNKIFNGSVHSACAYVWKFFYPKEEIPKIIQFIDNSDRKLFNTHISDSNSHYFNTSIGMRMTHNKSPLIQMKKRDGRLFSEIWELIEKTDPNFWIVIGYYYDQVLNNLKDQIAINARPANFQGYKVAVLNFNSPALSKQVGRQIITNFRNKGEHIDFAVCWGYEYTYGVYRIQLIDDHHQTRINLPDIARKLGKIGKTAKGGSGAGHVGNFYWPKNNEMDIWDLFRKTYI
jgi:hypothetical protein